MAGCIPVPYVLKEGFTMVVRNKWGKNMQKQIKDMVPVLKKLLVSSEDKTHTH
jgi:hypothetical protein